MDPKIYSKEAIAIAGVSGREDETSKVWEEFMELDKVNPLKNKFSEVEYEVRMYPGEGPGEVHIGVSVKDASVPAEYKVFFLPASLYAEFEIYPSKGWESSNSEIEKWLSDNAAAYTQGRMGDMIYAVEVYDERFKGLNDPDSVVGIWVPIVPAAAENVILHVLGPIEEISGRIEQFAGAVVCKNAMQGKDEILTAKVYIDPVKGALWMKEVIDRLDGLTDKETREKIMTACGRSCNAMNSKVTEEGRKMRQMCTTEEEYLTKLLQQPNTGIRYERDGETLIVYYTPRKYGEGVRCYCSLINMLPEGINASPTYCQCSRAFNQAYWVGVLGRPVRVELGETAISSGVDECKFIIHL